jgi:hypothetical protein
MIGDNMKASKVAMMASMAILYPIYASILGTAIYLIAINMFNWLVTDALSDTVYFISGIIRICVLLIVFGAICCGIGKLFRK